MVKEMLKPQEIRDQEFEIKFRGYDPVEVKSYLELLADDFFELSEEKRILQEKYDAATEAKEKRTKAVGALESLEGVDDLATEFDSGEAREESLEVIQEKLSHAKSRIETLTTENMGYLSQIGDLSKQLESCEKNSAQEQKEREELLRQIVLLGQQNAELKEKSSQVAQEGSEFQRLSREVEQLRSENNRLKKEEKSLKNILVSAQGFADTLRENAEKEVSEMIDGAKVQAKGITDQLGESVTRLSAEIKELAAREGKARSELLSVLEGYVAAIDDASAGILDTVPEKKASSQAEISQDHVKDFVVDIPE